MVVRLLGMLALGALLLGFAPPVPPPDVPTPPLTRVLRDLPVVGHVAGDVLSEVSSAQRFSLVGVSIPPGAHVLLRSATADGPWSPWMAMEPIVEGGDGPDPASGEAAAATPGWERMSAPLWTGDASRLQLRVRDGALEEVAVHLVDTLGALGGLGEAVSGLLSAPEAPAPALPAPRARPGIVTRAQWGADESRRKGTPSYGAPRAGMLHHTVTANDYTRAEAPAVVRAVYAYHTGSLGWSDIGYNLLVDRFGTVYEGRAGGVDRGVIGAHAGGFNTETFGVSVIGTFTSGLPPEAALGAVADLVAWKFTLHGINADPNSTVVMQSRGSTRYPSGHHARMHTLAGHRDVSTTACPGEALFAHLPALRQRIFAR